MPNSIKIDLSDKVKEQVITGARLQCITEKQYIESLLSRIDEDNTFVIVLKPRETEIAFKWANAVNITVTSLLQWLISEAIAKAILMGRCPIEDVKKRAVITRFLNALINPKINIDELDINIIKNTLDISEEGVLTDIIDLCRLYMRQSERRTKKSVKELVKLFLK